MSWKPYRVRPDGDGFRLTYSWWDSVPDGRGCIDWDEFTEDTDYVHPTREAADQDATDRNTAWLAADKARREAQRRG